MAVDIDETWSDEESCGIDLRRRALVRKVADSRDESVRDRHVGTVAGIARAVQDGAVPDDEVEPWGRWLRMQRHTATASHENTKTRNQKAARHRVQSRRLREESSFMMRSLSKP